MSDKGGIVLKRRDDGSFALTGSLSFKNVTALRSQGIDLFSEADTLVVDLSDVQRSDSAGVALLVEWMRFARSQDKTISYLNIPQQMLAIVRASSLDSILPLSRG